MMSLKKFVSGSLATVLLVGSIAATSVPAAAESGRHAAAAAGILGGLAAGALAAGVLAQPGPGPYYDDGPAPGYGCGYHREPVYDQWGRFAGYRPLPNC